MIARGLSSFIHFCDDNWRGPPSLPEKGLVETLNEHLLAVSAMKIGSRYTAEMGTAFAC
jgi:hypothetical protein